MSYCSDEERVQKQISLGKAMASVCPKNWFVNWNWHIYHYFFREITHVEVIIELAE